MLVRQPRVQYPHITNCDVCFYTVKCKRRKLQIFPWDFTLWTSILPFPHPGLLFWFLYFLSCLTTNAIVKKLFFTYKSLLFLWIMWITLCITIKCRKSVPLFVDNFVRFWDYICLRTCVLRQVVTHFPTCRRNRHCFLRRHSQFVKNAAFCVLPVWIEQGAACDTLRETTRWG